MGTLLSDSTTFPLFFCALFFFSSDVVDLVPIWYVALYLAINVCKSSTRCNTSFSTPDLIWCRFSLLKLWRQFRPVLSLPPSINRLSSCLVMFSVMAWSLSNYLDCPIVAVIMGLLVLLSEKPLSTTRLVGQQIAKTIFKLFIFYSYIIFGVGGGGLVVKILKRSGEGLN